MQLVIFYLKIFVNFFLKLNKALNFVLHRMLR
jgi:hypothetical protein